VGQRGGQRAGTTEEYDAVGERVSRQEVEEADNVDVDDVTDTFDHSQHPRFCQLTYFLSAYLLSQTTVMSVNFLFHFI